MYFLWHPGFHSSRRGNAPCLEIPAPWQVICSDFQLHMDNIQAAMDAKLRLGKQTPNTSCSVGLIYTLEVFQIWTSLKYLVNIGLNRY